MQAPDLNKITIDKIDDPLLKNKNVSLDILRLDKIHPVISGNKWFKLKYHLDHYKAGNYKGILTFGGAWSNHILATACTCHLKKIKSIGIIRGENPPQLSTTLEQAIIYGMQLKFISRDSFKRKNYGEVITGLLAEFPGYYFIPEGGLAREGRKGAGEILDLVNKDEYSHIVCAIGTATTFLGLNDASNTYQFVWGISVLKGLGDIIDQYRGSITPPVKKMYCKIFYDYHFGGYAKQNAELLSFMNNFYERTRIPTDFVYTGKLAFAINDLVVKDQFKPSSKILMIHSGGLQGNASLQKGSLIF